MKYTAAHLVTVSDIFSNFNVDKLKGKGNIKRTYKCADKMELTHKIFLRYLYHLFDGYVEGGHTFVFPNRQVCELRWRRAPAPLIKRNRMAGRLQDVDLLMTNYQYYQPCIYYKRVGKTFMVPIKLSDNFTDRMTEKMNTGYKYC